MRPEDVPPGPLVIDTDVFSYGYRRSGRWREFQLLTAGHPLSMSFASLGEALRPTFKRKGLAPGTTQRIRRALAPLVVLEYDYDIVERWARMAAILAGRLSKEGVNDMWTAACALSHDLPVVTNNLSDFLTIRQEVPDLVLVHPDL